MKAADFPPLRRRAVETLQVSVGYTCNQMRALPRLTILFEPGQDDLAEFLAANEVEIVASLPWYLAENADRQRAAA